MVIRSGRGQQSKIACMLRHGEVIIATVAARDHLQRFATKFGKFCKQAPQLTSGDLIACRVGNDGLATRRVDPAHRILELRPLSRHKTRFAIDQKTTKHGAQIRRMPLFNQKPRKVRTADQSSVGVGAGPFESTNDAMPGKATSDFFGTPIAELTQTGMSSGL